MNDPEANRCSYCDVNWPRAGDYTTCPTCGQPTWRARYEEPLNSVDARARVSEHRKAEDLRDQFEDYYDERESKAAEQAVEALLRDLDQPA